MTSRDTDWRPEGGLPTYEGYEVWEYEIGPHQLNEGEVDGDIEFDDSVHEAADGE